MEQRDQKMGEVVEGIPFEQALIAQNNVLKDEAAMLKAECHGLRAVIKTQAKAFADGKRASPFEDSVRELIKKEHNKLTLELLKKLKNDGFFKE